LLGPVVSLRKLPRELTLPYTSSERKPSMEKKKPQYQGDDIPPIPVPRIAYKRYEKANKLRDGRRAKCNRLRRADTIVVKEQYGISIHAGHP
jgi:hypothetical protein